MFTKSFTSRVLLSFASVIVLASSCMAVTDGGDAAPTGIDNEKRSWNNLQGSWGKRRDDTVYTDRDAAIALNDLLDAMRYGDEEDEYSRPLGQKRAWKNMNGAWGKRVDNWNKFRGKIAKLQSNTKFSL